MSIRLKNKSEIGRSLNDNDLIFTTKTNEDTDNPSTFGRIKNQISDFVRNLVSIDHYYKTEVYTTGETYNTGQTYTKDELGNLTGTTFDLDDLLDVDISGVTDYQKLIYSGGSWINSNLGFSNVINVAKLGGDFTTIKDALDSITNNTSVNRYTIFVSPGTYIENNPLQCKEYVTIASQGLHTAIVKPLNSNEHLFISVLFTHFTGLIFDGVTGAGKYTINHIVAGDVTIKNCVFKDCINGLLLNHVSATGEIHNCIGKTVFDTVDKMIHVTLGNLTLNGLNIRTTSTITTLVEVDGVGAFCSIRDIKCLSPNITTAFKFINGCRVSGAMNDIAFAYDGIIIYGDDTIVNMDVLKIFNLQNDGLRIENTGTGIELSMFSTTISGCGRWNFFIENPNSIVSGNGFTEINKGYIIEGAKFYATLLDITEDDEGLNIFGELRVGTPENPAESSLGEGDSYTRGMLVYTFDGSGFTDISVSASTASLSQFSFLNTSADTALYITSSLTKSDKVKHYGIKTKVITSGVMDSGSIVVEYWDSSGWTSVNIMETEGENKYFPKANYIFQTIGSNQIRYDIILANDNWIKNDPMTGGTDYYWIRFRIVSGITSSPVFEQFKLHTNRYEINTDGFIEYFGKARPIGQLPINIGSASPIEGNMQSQSIYISENIGVGFQTNKFTATTDILGLSTRLPYSVDTSSNINIIWSGLFNTSHTPEFTIRWGWVKQGDTISTTELGQVNNYNETTISRTVTGDTNEVFQANLDISGMIARRENGFGDELWVTLQITTLSGTFTITTWTADYTKWCEGGHI